MAVVFTDSLLVYRVGQVRLKTEFRYVICLFLRVTGQNNQARGRAVHLHVKANVALGIQTLRDYARDSSIPLELRPNLPFVAMLPTELTN